MALIPLADVGTRRVQAPRGPMLQQASNFKVNLTDVARNFAPVLQPQELLDNRGDLALARAGQDVAGVLGAVAERQMDAINIQKVAEAEDKMLAHQAEFENWKTQNPDETTWVKGWQDFSRQANDDILSGDLSPDARSEIQSRLTRWQNRGAIQTGVASAKTSFAKASDTLESQAMRHADNGDLESANEIRTTMVQKGMIGPDEAVRREFADRDRYKAKRLASITDGLDNAVMSGNDAEIPSLIQQAKDAGADENQVKALEQKAKIGVERTKEINQNKAQADFYGNLILQQAQGAVIVPAQIDAMAKEGKLNPLAAARLREQAQNNTGALPGEFQEFITKEVLTYDPVLDYDGAKKQAIMQKSFSMGLRQDQAIRFNDAFNAAVKRNGTASGRDESQLRSWAHSHIDEMWKKGAFGAWDTKAAGVDETVKAALADKAKMAKILGVTLNGEKGDKADVATRIADTVSLDPQKALDMFGKAAKVPQDKSGLDQGSYNHLMKAVSDLEKMDVKSTSGAKAAELQDRVGSWFDDFIAKEKRKPTADEVKRKLGDLTRDYTDPAVWQVFAPQKTTAMATPDRISIRGFEDAPDLAQKLPDSLALYSQDFIDAGKQYGVDPYALAAIAMHETGGGKSSAFSSKNNAMGTSDDSGPRTFASVRDSIMHQARVLGMQNGPYAGLATLDQIGNVYAPPGAANDQRKLNRFWKNGVASYYNQLRN